MFPMIGIIQPLLHVKSNQPPANIASVVSKTVHVKHFHLLCFCHLLYLAVNINTAIKCYSLQYISLSLGAHFLEVVVTKFDGSHRSIDAQRDKCCYNSVLVIAYLYNYLVR